MLMKSIMYILISLFAGTSLSAQVFVGGNINFSTTNSKQDRPSGLRETNNSSIGLRPVIGKFVADKLAIGLALDFTSTKSKTDYINFSQANTLYAGINPFIRYYAVSWNKFSIYGQGNILLGFSRIKDEFNGAFTESSGTRFGVNFYPGLNYDLSDKISLFTAINVLGIGYNYEIIKVGTLKEKSSRFNIGAGLDNILSIGAINIGAIYKF